MRLPFLVKPFLCFTVLTFSSLLTAQDTDKVLDSSKKTIEAAKASQQKVDKLADSTDKLVDEYRQTSKIVEDLTIYNKKLEIQINKQEERLQKIEKSISDVKVIQRQITPLVENMIDVLEAFVQLDVPFHKEEREQRISFLRNNLDRPDLSVSEKFRQVIEAYKIENEYGRKIDTYTDSIKIDGVEREVNMLRIGRIALLYQTSDMEYAGMWNQNQREWQALDAGEYEAEIRKGIRIANKQAAIDIIELPVPAPEAL